MSLIAESRLEAAFRHVVVAAGALLALACGASDERGVDGDDLPEIVEGACVIPAGESPDSAPSIGCRADFDALASAPLDAAIPGARSTKVVLDQFDDTLYFQNSTKYPLHHDFASESLSGPARPIVPLLSEFNRREYSASDRRFILGAVTYYEGADAWVLEIAPYDTASAPMIEQLYTKVAASSYFGPALRFHPTSETVAAQAADLPGGVRQMSTDELFAAIDYQPLNLGEAIGQLRFVEAAALETEYVGAREIVVLDRVPNDISVTAGLITQEFQTPLSHINVLAQNRKTPNMGLRNATTNDELLALEGKWVKLVVGAFDWSVAEVSQAEADAWWEAHKPTPVALPELDLSVTELRDVKDMVDETTLPLRQAIQQAVLAFGAKATNYGVLANTEGVPIRAAFGIPVYHYVQFMEAGGFHDRVRALLADATFQGSAEERDLRLAELRADMEAAPVSEELQGLLRAKIEADFPGQTLRFRTSTNAEDLDGFPCAGCYESHTGDPADWEGDLLRAIKETWAGVWFFRTFEERAYHSIDHTKVGMALLVHHNFPDEEANGVALTANPFRDEPGFYANVQKGGAAEVVHPPPGITSDEFICYFDQPGPPVEYLAHSNLVPKGETVLTTEQIVQLGTALSAIHERFSPAYGPLSGNDGWYAMDVEFKFDDEDDPGKLPGLVVKQARPHPGRGK